jgi:copper transport protein
VVARRRLLCLVAGALAGAALIAPAQASAHATLEGTSPARGAVVPSQPGAVIFRFDEPVEGNFGAVRVFDASGAEVDQSDAFHPNGDGPRLGVHLKSDLPDGSYTATYRVVSADGHIVSGGFVFSIGKPGAAPKQTVAQLVGKSGSGPITDIAMGIARGVQFGSIALAIGLLAFLLLVWSEALPSVAGSDRSWLAAAQAFAGRWRTLLYLAAVLGLLSALLGIVMEAAQAAGISGFSALKSTVIHEELGTRFGTVWGIAALTWFLLGLLIPVVAGERLRAAMPLRPAELGATGIAAERPGALRTLPLVLPLCYLALVPALSGHGSTQSPTGVIFPANVIHVVGVGVWLGGLATLLLAVPRATRELPGTDRSRLLAAALTRFSQIALICVGAILATGLVQAYVMVRHPHALVDTAYGRAVLIKFILLLGLIGLGAYNRRRSVPRLRRLADEGVPPGRAGLLLRRALRAEVAVLVVVLGVTGALAAYAPATTTQTGPYSASATAGSAEIEITVDPATVGSNQIHLYLFDATSGAQFTQAQEVQVSATETDRGIGPLDLTPQQAGPGHYIVPAALLNVPGTWKIEITVRTSKFDEFVKAFDVQIR